MSKISVPYIALLCAAFIIALFVVIVFYELAWMIFRLFPLRLTEEEIEERLDLQELYTEELNKIELWEYFLSLGMGILTPFLFLMLANWLILRTVPSPHVLIHTGGLMMAIPLFIAGTLIGVGLVPSLIQGHFPHPHSQTLMKLYSRSEELKYGWIGRLMLTKSRFIAAAIILLVIALTGNRYTVIARDRIDIPNRAVSSKRILLSPAGISRLVILRRWMRKDRLSGPEYFIFMKNGRILSSAANFGRRVGELADLFRNAEDAFRLLSEKMGVRIESIVLEKNQRFPGLKAGINPRKKRGTPMA